jgi:hypothetical protein
MRATRRGDCSSAEIYRELGERARAELHRGRGEEAILSVRSAVDPDLLDDEIAGWLATRASVISPPASRLGTEVAGERPLGQLAGR